MAIEHFIACMSGSRQWQQPHLVLTERVHIDLYSNHARCLFCCCLVCQLEANEIENAKVQLLVREQVSTARSYYLPLIDRRGDLIDSFRIFFQML